MSNHICNTLLSVMCREWIVVDIIILDNEFPTANLIIEYLLEGLAFLGRMPNGPMIFAKSEITFFLLY